MLKKSLVLALFLVVLPVMAQAEVNADFRIKFGGAAGIKDLTFDGATESVEPSFSLT